MNEALPYDWSYVRGRLQDDLWRLLDRLKLRDELTGRQNGDGRHIWPRSPLRADKKPGSFCIWITGDARGAWKDFARAEHKGDVFDLIQQCERLAGKMDVYWWALDFLNLDRKGNRAKPRRQSDAEQERIRRQRQAEDDDAALAREEAARSDGLFRLWRDLPPIAGTPAEHYLRQVRKIPLERLAHPPGALRWAEAAEWIDPATGEVKEWRNVMVSAMTRGRRVVALHRTYLKPDGSGKADRVKPKLMIGPVKGSAIRLASGPSGLSPHKAAERGRRDPLAIGEGIETCLSVAVARPDYRVWAAGSLSLMALFDWPECASAVVLLSENDWEPEAQRAFQRVQAHWQAQAHGRPVHVVASAVGSDFNDWAKRGAA